MTEPDRRLFQTDLFEATHKMSSEELLRGLESLPYLDELDIWDERYYLNNHMIKESFSTPTIQTRRNSGMNLIKFYSGEMSLYSGILTDMRTVILSMRTPGNIEVFLFNEFLSASGTQGSTAEVTTTKIGPSTADEQPGEEGDLLAKEITILQLSSKNINPFWINLLKYLNENSTKGLSEKGVMAETILGLISLHCLKLICKTPEYTYKSMSRRLDHHFRDLYKPSDWSDSLIPPNLSSLKYLVNSINPERPEVLELLSILIGKVIIENAKQTSNASIKRVLYDSCLTDISMYGLTPVKLVEQAADALNMPVESFVKMMDTTLIKQSLDNVCKVIELFKKPIGKVDILGTEYDIKRQISWRFCRIYNQQHFNRFRTKLNTRLIIRCAAYLSCTPKGQGIAKMTILDSTLNKRFFEQEREFAQRYFRSLRAEQPTCPDNVFS